jgi:hypothetical protein
VLGTCCLPFVLVSRTKLTLLLSRF